MASRWGAILGQLSSYAGNNDPRVLPHGRRTVSRCAGILARLLAGSGGKDERIARGDTLASRAPLFPADRYRRKASHMGRNDSRLRAVRFGIAASAYSAL